MPSAISAPRAARPARARAGPPATDICAPLSQDRLHVGLVRRNPRHFSSRLETFSSRAPRTSA